MGWARALARGALGGVAGAVVACGAGPASEPPPSGTRVVLISADTLRLDAFEGSPERPSAMPQTAAFARRGARFDQFYTASNVTQPSHATLLTALHPWQHGMTRNGQTLDERHVTVAERFRDAGYSTAAVVASYPLLRKFGLGQGFDVYEDRFDLSFRRQWEGHAVEADRFYSLADRITDSALALLDREDSQRQFLWVHYFDPHDPFGDQGAESVEMKDLVEQALGGSPYLDAAIDRARELYDRDVAFMDAALGRLLTALEADAGRFETHVVFVSDHGESFGEEGNLGHGATLGVEQLRVPLFVLSPRVEAGVRGDLAASIDIPATLLSLASIPAEVAGRDLTLPPEGAVASPVGMRADRAPRADFGAEGIARRRRFYAWVDGQIYVGNADRVRALAKDASAPPEALAAELRQRFAGFERELLASAAAEQLDPETREALEALGYTE